MNLIIGKPDRTQHACDTHGAGMLRAYSHLEFELQTGADLNRDGALDTFKLPAVMLRAHSKPLSPTEQDVAQTLPRAFQSPQGRDVAEIIMWNIL